MLELLTLDYLTGGKLGVSTAIIVAVLLSVIPMLLGFGVFVKANNHPGLLGRLVWSGEVTAFSVDFLVSLVAGPLSGFVLFCWFAYRNIPDDFRFRVFYMLYPLTQGTSFAFHKMGLSYFKKFGEYGSDGENTLLNKMLFVIGVALAVWAMWVGASSENLLYVFVLGLVFAYKMEAQLSWIDANEEYLPDFVGNVFLLPAIAARITFVVGAITFALIWGVPQLLAASPI